LNAAERKTVERAAWLLEREAAGLRDSCEAGGRDWTCQECTTRSTPCALRRDYDEMLDVAAAIKVILA
jgi:hypothetical protein